MITRIPPVHDQARVVCAMGSDAVCGVPYPRVVMHVIEAKDITAAVADVAALSIARDVVLSRSALLERRSEVCFHP